MKKTKYILSFLFISVVITSCYKDQGNYDYKPIGNIEISGFEDKYSLIAGVDTLKILPKITTSYNENDLEYTWLLYDKGNNIDTIGHKKELEYIVGKSGSYKLFLYVKNTENDYYVHATTKFEASTIYSKGHYIFKETADGNTDMDLITISGNLVSDRYPFVDTGTAFIRDSPQYGNSLRPGLLRPGFFKQRKRSLPWHYHQ